jgi:hypothetical protein
MRIFNGLVRVVNGTSAGCVFGYENCAEMVLTFPDGDVIVSKV